jgi:hypothetical protein
MKNPTLFTPKTLPWNISLTQSLLIFENCIIPKALDVLNDGKIDALHVAIYGHKTTQSYRHNPPITAIRKETGPLSQKDVENDLDIDTAIRHMKATGGWPHIYMAHSLNSHLQYTNKPHKIDLYLTSTLMAYIPQNTPILNEHSFVIVRRQANTNVSGHLHIMERQKEVRDAHTLQTILEKCHPLWLRQQKKDWTSDTLLNLLE